MSPIELSWTAKKGITFSNHNFSRLHHWGLDSRYLLPDANDVKSPDGEERCEMAENPAAAKILVSTPNPSPLSTRLENQPIWTEPPHKGGLRVALGGPGAQ